MPLPISGTVARAVSLYPFPGYTAAEITSAGTCILDDAGTIAFVAITITTGGFVGHSFVAKYVYATSTLTEFCAIGTTTSGVRLCWNADKTKIIVWDHNPGGASPYPFWEVDTTTGVKTSIGSLPAIVGGLTQLQPNATYGYVGNAPGSKTFFAVDLGTLTSTKILESGQFMKPLAITADYFYTTLAGDAPGPGPVLRLHRAKSFLVEFLAGTGYLAPDTSIATTNLAYAGVKICPNFMFVRGNVLYIHHFYLPLSPNSILVWLDLTTLTLRKLVDGFGSTNNGFMDVNAAGDIILAADGTGMTFYN